MTYLDWASTSPPDGALLSEAAELAGRLYANPSSAHAAGREAREALEAARAELLGVLGGGGATLAFTGSGSEADAIVLLSLLRKPRSSGGPPHLVVSAIEHAAVHEEADLLEKLGIAVTRVRPRSDGRLDPAEVAEALRRETVLVAVMAVNNETGAVQPLAGIAAALARAAESLGRKPPPLHADAVQALGKIDFEPAALGLSSAAFSAHKLRGPRGVGALWIGAGAPRLAPLAVGGGQEGGLRPGTESLQGAYAFARAARAATAGLAARRGRARELEARLIAGLEAGGALPLPLGRRAGDEAYSPFILSAAFPGLSGEVLARVLSDEGIAVSTGSACSTRTARKGRRVLDAMGLEPALAQSAIRVSTGEDSLPGDVDRFLEVALSAWRRLKT